MRKGIYKPGEIVHHKIELDPININKPEVALGFNNLEMLCRECHAEIHGCTWDKVNQRKRNKRDDKNRYKVDEYGRVEKK